MTANKEGTIFKTIMDISDSFIGDINGIFLIVMIINKRFIHATIVNQIVDIIKRLCLNMSVWKKS